MEDWEVAFRQEIAQQGHSGFIVDVMVDNERRRREKERDAERNKIPLGALLVSPNIAPISGGTPATTSSFDMPMSYHKYATRLVAAIEYLANNNYGTAKVSVDDEINVTPQHLRNTLRAVRNYMLSNPPMGYPIQNLTFVEVADGVVIRDKRKSEPFKISVPVSKPNTGVPALMPYPLVATPELIAALAVVLAAVDESGAFIEWPNFALEMSEENKHAYNVLMRSSFPPHWTVGEPMMTTAVTRKR